MNIKYFKIFFVMDYLVELGTSTSNTCKIYFKKEAIALGGTFTESSSHGDSRCHTKVDYQIDSTESWCALNNDNSNDWLGINYSGIVLWVGITTRGRPRYSQWVKSYKVKYTEDGSTWMWYNGGEDLIGNVDMNSALYL